MKLSQSIHESVFQSILPFSHVPLTKLLSFPVLDGVTIMKPYKFVLAPVDVGAKHLAMIDHNVIASYIQPDVINITNDEPVLLIY